MASYRAVAGVLTALKDFLELRMQDDLVSFVGSPSVSVLGSKELSADPTGNRIGLYLHRISVDPFGRNRYLHKSDPNTPAQPELSVNLHVLLIAWTENGENEGTLVGWAMQQMGSSLELDVSHLGVADVSWSDREQLQIVPEDMTTEDLLRIWDGLPTDYRLSIPYLVKTLRLLPVPEIEPGPKVDTIAIPFGVEDKTEVKESDDA